MKQDTEKDLLEEQCIINLRNTFALRFTFGSPSSWRSYDPWGLAAAGQAMGRLPLVKPWAGELHDDDLLAPAVIKAGATKSMEYV